MTLREGRAELHDRLNAAAYEMADGLWSQGELIGLLVEARDAVTRCPHEACAYCYQVERNAS